MKKLILIKRNIESQVKEAPKIRKLMSSANNKNILFTKLGIIYISAFFLLSSKEVKIIKAEEQSLRFQQETIHQTSSVKLKELCIINTSSGLVLQNVQNRVIEEKIKYYCKIFQLKEEIAIKKIREITDNFTDLEWLKNNNIKGTKVRGQESVYPSQELGILVFVKYLKQHPEDFNLELSTIASDIEYQLDMSYEEFTEKICNLMDYLDPELCQAIQYYETGFYTRKVFLEKNNVGGIRTKSGEFQSFDNVAESIIELAFLLEYKYLIDLNIAESSNMEEVIQRIQKKYCPLILGEEENHNWLPRVTEYYYKIQEEYSSHGYQKTL